MPRGKLVHMSADAGERMHRVTLGAGCHGAWASAGHARAVSPVATEPPLAAKLASWGREGHGRGRSAVDTQQVQELSRVVTCVQRCDAKHTWAGAPLPPAPTAAHPPRGRWAHRHACAAPPRAPPGWPLPSSDAAPAPPAAALPHPVWPPCALVVERLGVNREAVQRAVSGGWVAAGCQPAPAAAAALTAARCEPEELLTGSGALSSTTACSLLSRK